jgi:hypothetical protein
MATTPFALLRLMGVGGPFRTIHASTTVMSGLSNVNSWTTSIASGDQHKAISFSSSLHSTASPST